MAARLARNLVGREQFVGRDPAAPHLRLEAFDQPLDRFFGIAALRREAGAIALRNHAEEAAMSEHALDRIMDHVVRDDALLRAADRLGRGRGPFDH